MAAMNFVLPMTKDDLLECNSPADRYSVATLCDEKEVFKKLRDAKKDLQGENDPYFIFNYFDVIFSVLFHFNRLDSHAQKRSWHVTVQACSQFKEHLVAIFQASDIDCNERKKCVNALKMLVYLLTQHISNFETLLDKKSCKEDKKLIKSKGSTKGRRQTDAGVGSLEFDWAEESRDAMVLLHHLMQLPIQRLWSTPLVDEQFVSTVGNCCYKLLDDPDIHLVKLKAMRELIFDVLGILVKHHVHTNTFVTTIVKSLKGTENVNSSNVLAKGVLAIAQKYHMQGLVCCVVNEVAVNGIPEFSTDSSAAKSYSDFLIHLAEGDPVMMMPGVDILLPLLDQDPYQLRNCVLSVLAEVLLQDIKLGNLDDEKREAFREEIYTNLLEHLMDNHTFVRSKVCQIWLNLLSSNAVPMPLHPQLLKVVVERLEDRSAAVRKYAMQLVTAFLDEHTYVAKLGLAEVKMRLKMNSLILAKMEVSSKELTLDEGVEISWKNIEGELEVSILECLESDATHKETLEASTIQKALDTCRRLLAVRKFSEAVEMLRLCETGDESPHSTCSLAMSERLKLYKGIIKRLMFGGQAPPAPLEGASADAVPGGAEPLPENSQNTENAEMSALINPFSYINPTDKDVGKTKDLVSFLRVSYKVGLELSIAIPHIRELLTSSVATDVIEAVDFFTSAQHQSLDGISEGLQDMLNLIWSPDAAIKTVIAEAFRIIYLSPDIEDSKVRAQKVVDNLTLLVQSPGLRLREKAALEKLMVQWIEKNHLTNATVLLLWDRFYLRVDTTEDDSRAALIILTMIAKSERKWSMLKNNMDDLVENGFGERGHKDFRIAMLTCQMLANLAPKKLSDETETTGFRMPKDHPMFSMACRVIVNGLMNFENDQYTPMATEALNLIFKLSDRPDQTFELLLKDLIRSVIDADLSDGKATKLGNKNSEYISVILARLFHCTGHIGLLLFQYLDKDIYIEIKKHRAVNDKVSDKKKSVNFQRSASFVSRQSSSSIVSTTENEDELEGAAAEDEDAELIKGFCDKQILASSHLLGNLSQLVEFVVTHVDLYQNVNLQTAATMTLGKLMAISQTFCEKNQENLVTYALKAKDPVIRSNGLLILRDLAFRFPTLMEPTVSHLYARLHDESREVRANAMAALSSLILTEMVKAKSNIGQLARCIVDEDQDMVQRAKELFKMMSDKGNQLYNALPDIISKLSSSEEKVEEEEFRTIMKYIMSLIQKDKQHELLVEKLCARFKLTEDERQWRDLAFCLSLLTYSDRSLRKLMDNMPNYADKLQHEPVFACMQAIVDQTTKQAKPELKTILEELSERLQNCQEKGVDDGACTQKVSQKVSSKPKKTRTKRNPVTNSTRKKSRRTRASSSTSESENDSEGSGQGAPSKPAAKMPARSKAKTPARAAALRRKAAKHNDGSSSNDDE